MRVRPQVTQGILVSRDLGFPVHEMGPLEQSRDTVPLPEQDPLGSFGGTTFNSRRPLGKSLQYSRQEYYGFRTSCFKITSQVI